MSKLPGMKFNQKKLRYELIPFVSLDQLAAVFTFGALKYEDHNWKGMDPVEGIEWCRAAMMRHVSKLEQGQEIDPDSGLNHWAHICWNAVACLWHANQLDKVPTMDEAWETANWDEVKKKYAKLRARRKRELERKAASDK
jgi:hypothetical protein